MTDMVGGLWAGSALTKSLSAVYVPIEDMTQDHFDILDWKNLRPVAKNRIAEVFWNDELTGFYMVNIVQKRRAKGGYLWPGTEAMVEKYGLDGTGQFVYETDGYESEGDLLYSDKVAAMDALVVLFAWRKMEALVEALFNEIEQQDEEDQIGENEPGPEPTDSLTPDDFIQPISEDESRKLVIYAAKTLGVAGLLKVIVAQHEAGEISDDEYAGILYAVDAIDMDEYDAIMEDL